MLIEISNRQHSVKYDASRLKQAVELVLREGEITAGEISIAVVDDAEMHKLNFEYLAHNYPTDVLSFVLEREGGRLEGELIVSADTAQREAQRVGWSASDELLLYAIHGALHLVGYDDTTESLAEAMRSREACVLAMFGLQRRV
jgi:probable rRNA maturation factor